MADSKQSAFDALESMLFENVVKSLRGQIQRETKGMSRRLTALIRAFNEKFPKGTEERQGAQAVAWGLMGGPIALILSEYDDSALIDLHGMLEYYARRELALALARDAAAADLLIKMFEKKVLIELAESLADVGIWNKQDVAAARRLGELRNAMAHKNPRKLSNLLGNGKDLHFLDAAILPSEFDGIPSLLLVIQMMLKLCAHSAAAFEKAQVRKREAEKQPATEQNGKS